MTDALKQGPASADEDPPPAHAASYAAQHEAAQHAFNTQQHAAAAAAGGADKKATNSQLVYGILDVPPWPAAIALGLQQYLTMLGSTVLIPFICVPAMGGSPQELALVICTIFFVSGIITLLQTLIGDRLPIIQGGSFAYINPVLAIAGQIKASHTFASDHERFLVTMREVQGGIIGSGLLVMLVGLTGVIKPVLRAISPITVAANIGVLGLALYNVGFPGVTACPQLGITQITLCILFSQYLRGVAVPLPSKLGGRVRLFELFPVLLSILLTWFIAWLLTIGGAYNTSPAAVQAACRTDQSHVLADAPWIRFPYPFQWGLPTMSWAGTLTMLAGALPAMVESLGDYYAAADICGAPVPPPAVISRAIALQGASCVLAGMWGTSSGTTAYNENIGSMQITRVGSRRVVQYGAIFAIVMGLIGKFGGLFASLPNALVSGLFCVMFGIICAVGLAQMRHTDQHSNRNVFILGFSLYMGLSIPYYFTEYVVKNPGSGGPIQTSSSVANNILNSIFSTAAAVALLLTLLLDNTVPGSDTERGLHVWQNMVAGSDDDPAGAGADQDKGQDKGQQWHWYDDDHLNRVYGLPFNGTRKLHQHILQPLAAWRDRTIVLPLRRRLPPWCTACCRGGRDKRHGGQGLMQGGPSGERLVNPSASLPAQALPDGPSLALSDLQASGSREAAVPSPPAAAACDNSGCGGGGGGDIVVMVGGNQDASGGLGRLPTGAAAAARRPAAGLRKDVGV